ncbi:MAG: CDP-diacylglycerol--glycerol-3-phosphate 3-phosphatidyltransferase [Eggerthellaceae bacterium]|nr:CDP-diacylglycerol--glycerol-3-phosphate 3-phosphatidyltransferase [Eggerthellaceae bacterium]
MSAGKGRQEQLWTPANVVTLLRICGVPVFVIALISPWPSLLAVWPDAGIWKEWVAAGIFIVLAATDGLDGYLARSRGEVTNFGKFVDPLADKILVAAALLALIELGVLPSWVALVILTREFIVSGIRMVAATQGTVIAASWFGKWKTVFQIVALVLFIVKDSRTVSGFSPGLGYTLTLLSWGVMLVALALTVISMLDYFVKAKPLLGFDGPTEAPGDADGTPLGQVGPPLPAAPDFSPEGLEGLAQEVIERARAQRAVIGTAESCTGGLVAAALTSVPGSSDVVAGAVVSYSNAVKEARLGVSAQTLARHGAVSGETAREMAAGAAEALGATLTVAVTGIAGPGGGSVEKPVGTVWVALFDSQGTHAQEYRFEGTRDQVRAQAARHALEALLQGI